MSLRRVTSLLPNCSSPSPSKILSYRRHCLSEDERGNVCLSIPSSTVCSYMHDFTAHQAGPTSNAQLWPNLHLLFVNFKARFSPGKFKGGVCHKIKPLTIQTNFDAFRDDYRSGTGCGWVHEWSTGQAFQIENEGCTVFRTKIPGD